MKPLGVEYAPFAARRAIQQAIWERCIQPAENEWTTWTDAIILAECAATALWEAGYVVSKDRHWFDGTSDG